MCVIFDATFKQNKTKINIFVYLNGIKLLRSNDHWLLLLLAPNMRKGPKSWVDTGNKDLVSNKKVRKMIFFPFQQTNSILLPFCRWLECDLIYKIFSINKNLALFAILQYYVFQLPGPIPWLVPHNGFSHLSIFH